MPQDPRSVLAVEEVFVQESIKSGEEGRIVEVLGGDEDEETLESRHSQTQIPHVKAVGEEVHQNLWPAET